MILRKIIFHILLLSCLLLGAITAGAQYTAGNIYFGKFDYTEYHAGDLPIIISAPHGGYLTPASIPDRTYGVTVRDGWTEEVTYKLDSAIQAVFGGYPHVIFNKLARTKLDANREIVEAAQGNPDADTAWYEFHDFIQAAKDKAVNDWGTALYIDMHAHGHNIQRIELGYLLTGSELRMSDTTLNGQNFQDSSAIRYLKNVLNSSSRFSEMLRGHDCMGACLEHHGYPSVPSASDTAPAVGDPYFNGGYNTRRHGSIDSSAIVGMQFELNYDDIRNNDANRNKFARSTACAIKHYLDRWFFDLESWDPGHVVTSTADNGPGSLRSALLGAENGTVITFDPSIHGDTIFLEKELIVCGNITIQGPGADQMAISGADSVIILRTVPRDTVNVYGLSFVNGYASQGKDGGAIVAEGNLNLSNCIIENCYATDDGGAISSVDSFITVRLDSCIIRNNSCGDDGGALRCLNGIMIINACTVDSNFSPSNGGALSADGTVIITNSTFAYNRATSNGGAIRNFADGIIICENSTFANNIADYRGGAISTGAHVELNFSTIAHNTSSSLGGGLRIPTGGSVILQNTLIAENTGSSGHDVSLFSASITSNGYNLIGDSTGSTLVPAIGDQLGNTATPINPLINALADNDGVTETIALQIGSPAIDMANTTGAPANDQRGQSRSAGTQPDIGAYEFCMPTSGSDTQTACDSFSWIDGHTYYADTNSATFVLTNAEGCDSTVTLNLTINQSSYFTDVNSACDSFTWINGSTYYTDNNSATVVLTNEDGCDSVIALDLAIDNSSYYTDVNSACDSFTWIDGITYFANNNTATFTTSNAVGCDSVITLDLTIYPVYSDTLINTSACMGDVTNILGDTHTIFSDIVLSRLYTSINGCDSTVYAVITANQSNYVVNRSDTICESGSIDINGTILTAANAGPGNIIPSIDLNGCDFTYDITLLVNNESYTVFSDTVCENDSFLIAGVYVQAGETDTIILSSIHSCDSFIIAHIASEICLGISVNEFGNDLQIYPNPTNGQVMVDLGLYYTSININVYSINGQLVQTQHSQNIDQLKFDIEANPGLYFVEIIADDKRALARIMVE